MMLASVAAAAAAAIVFVIWIQNCMYMAAILHRLNGKQNKNVKSFKLNDKMIANNLADLSWLWPKEGVFSFSYP